MSIETKVNAGKEKSYLFPILSIFAPALTIAVCLGILGVTVYQNNMNVFELTNAISEKYYLLILALYIVVLPLFFPFTIKLFKKSGISLSQKFTSRKTIFKDIAYGIIAGIVSYIFIFLDVHVVLKIPLEKTINTQLILLELISLVFISGFFKEIYFKGIPYYLLKNKFGEWKSFLLGNVCFAILDWPNLGLSFFTGLIWYLFFRKRGALIIPIVGHGFCNLLSIVARAGALSFIGIIPV